MPGLYDVEICSYCTPLVVSSPSDELNMSPHNGPLQLLAQLDTTSPQLFDLLSAADLVSDLSAEGAQLLVDHLDGVRIPSPDGWDPDF